MGATVESKTRLKGNCNCNSVTLDTMDGPGMVTIYVQRSVIAPSNNNDNTQQ